MLYYLVVDVFLLVENRAHFVRVAVEARLYQRRLHTTTTTRYRDREMERWLTAASRSVRRRVTSCFTAPTLCPKHQRTSADESASEPPPPGWSAAHTAAPRRITTAAAPQSSTSRQSDIVVPLNRSTSHRRDGDRQAAGDTVKTSPPPPAKTASRQNARLAARKSYKKSTASRS